MMVKARVMRLPGSDFYREYDMLEKWIATPGNGANWASSCGMSIVNGTIIKFDIEFASEQDFIMCKLAFPTMIALYNDYLVKEMEC